MTYVIKSGDTLRGIAARLLGDPEKWIVLWKLNQSRLRSGDPDIIYVGETIEIPTEQAEVAKTLPPRASDEVVLLVDGTLYSGWTEVSIKRALEAASGSFSVSLTERWPGQTAKWPIYAGSGVQVYIGQELCISGWVDEVKVAIDATTHSMSVSGRDRTADIIDCSAIQRPGQWRNKKLESIAADLCSPFGVKVRADASTGSALTEFSAQPGETVYECLERAAKKCGLLVSSDPEGTLLFTRSGSQRFATILKEGDNLESIEGSFSSKERFSKYIVESQTSGSGEAAKVVKAQAEDQAITRYRPLAIMAEDQATPAQALARAKYEAQIRAARALVFTARLPGWRAGTESIWKPNRIVALDAPSVRGTGDVLIEQVEFSLGEGGSSTTLTLKRPDAFAELPSWTVPTTKMAAGWATE